jgi:hypothetical protein
VIVPDLLEIILNGLLAFLLHNANIFVDVDDSLFYCAYRPLRMGFRYFDNPRSTFRMDTLRFFPWIPHRGAVLQPQPIL